MGIRDNKLLRSKLQSIPTIEITDIGQRKCGIVTFYSPSKDASQIKRALILRKINVSVSVRSSTLLDMQSRGLNKIVRDSVHYYNTEEEMDRFCLALSEIIREEE